MPDIVDAVVADDVGLLKQYLASGENVNIIDESGWSPIVWCAKKGNAAIMRALLDADALVNATDETGSTGRSRGQRECRPAY